MSQPTRKLLVFLKTCNAKDPLRDRRMSDTKYVQWTQRPTQESSDHHMLPEAVQPPEAWGSTGYVVLPIQGQLGHLPIPTHPSVAWHILKYIIKQSTLITSTEYTGRVDLPAEKHIRHQLASGNTVYIQKRSEDLDFWAGYDFKDKSLNQILCPAEARIIAQDLLSSCEGEQPGRLKTPKEVPSSHDREIPIPSVEMRFQDGLALLDDPLSAYRITIPCLSNGPRPAPVQALSDDRRAIAATHISRVPRIPSASLFTDGYCDIMPALSWQPPLTQDSGFQTWQIVARGIKIYFVLEDHERRADQLEAHWISKSEKAAAGKHLNMEYDVLPPWLSSHGMLSYDAYAEMLQAGTVSAYPKAASWKMVVASEGDLIMFPAGAVVAVYSPTHSCAFGGHFLNQESGSLSRMARRSFILSGLVLPPHQGLRHLYPHEAFLFHAFAIATSNYHDEKKVAPNALPRADRLDVNWALIAEHWPSYFPSFTAKVEGVSPHSEAERTKPPPEESMRVIPMMGLIESPLMSKTPPGSVYLWNHLDVAADEVKIQHEPAAKGLAHMTDITFATGQPTATEKPPKRLQGRKQL